MANLMCKVCSGQLMFLGQLGYLRHYICRDCGMNFNKTPKIIRDKFDRVISVKY